MKPSNFLRALEKIQPEDLESIKGVGKILASNIIEFAKSKRAKNLQKGFERLEEQDKAPELLITAVPVSVKGSVCITGVFDIPRSQIKELLESKGYKVVDSITKTTTVLLAGKEAGGKLEKAKKMNIEIESDYKKL